MTIRLVISRLQRLDLDKEMNSGSFKNLADKPDSLIGIQRAEKMMT